MKFENININYTYKKYIYILYKFDTVAYNQI